MPADPTAAQGGQGLAPEGDRGETWHLDRRAVYRNRHGAVGYIDDPHSNPGLLAVVRCSGEDAEAVAARVHAALAGASVGPTSLAIARIACNGAGPGSHMVDTQTLCAVLRAVGIDPTKPLAALRAADPGPGPGVTGGVEAFAQVFDRLAAQADAKRNAAWTDTAAMEAIQAGARARWAAEIVRALAQPTPGTAPATDPAGGRDDA